MTSRVLGIYYTYCRLILHNMRLSFMSLIRLHYSVTLDGILYSPCWMDEALYIKLRPLVDNIGGRYMFNNIWVECGPPRDDWVASIMRRTRALYHYAVRREA